jgi:hypothetical protein
MGSPETMIVVDRNGREFEIPVSSAQSAIDAGMTPQTPEGRIDSLTKQAHEESSGGIRGAIGAFGSRALSAATLGGSDVVLGAIGGEDTKRELRRLAEVNPGAALAGTVAGSVLPIIPGLGSSALVKASPVGLANRAGSEIAGLGQGAGLLGRTAAATGGAATEGALQNLGSYASQVALGDRELSADGFIGAMGNGALYGGVAGGALTLAGGGLSAARRLFPKQQVTREAVEALDGDAVREITGAVDDTKDLERAARARLREIREETALSDLTTKLELDRIAVQKAQDLATAHARKATAQASAAEARALRAVAGPANRSRKVFGGDETPAVGAPEPPLTPAQQIADDVVNAPPITAVESAEAATLPTDAGTPVPPPADRGHLISPGQSAPGVTLERPVAPEVPSRGHLISPGGPVPEIAPAVSVAKQAEAATPTSFGEDVYAAAAKAEKYGDHNAYISSVYEQMPPASRGASLDEFKKKLIKAQRDSEVYLKRADLVDSMSADLVEASEINSLGADFHFIDTRTRPTGLGPAKAPATSAPAPIAAPASAESPAQLFAKNNLKSTISESGNEIELQLGGPSGQVGRLKMVRQSDGQFRLSHVRVDKEVLQGKGLGTAMYREMADYLDQKYGAELVSDFSRSPQAEKLWERLVKKGEARGVVDTADPYYRPGDPPSYYVMNRPSKAPAPTGLRAVEPAPTAAPPSSFADDVYAAAENAAKFGPDKAFISSIYKNMPEATRGTLDEFKTKLLKAQRDGDLIMTRADLVAAMDRKVVADSTIRDMGAEFQFVNLQRPSPAKPGGAAPAVARTAPQTLEQQLQMMKAGLDSGKTLADLSPVKRSTYVEDALNAHVATKNEEARRILAGLNDLTESRDLMATWLDKHPKGKVKAFEYAEGMRKPTGYVETVPAGEGSVGLPRGRSYEFRGTEAERAAADAKAIGRLAVGEAEGVTSAVDEMASRWSAKATARDIIEATDEDVLTKGSSTLDDKIGSALKGKTDDFADDLEDATHTVGRLERAIADMSDELGIASPPRAAGRAKGYRDAQGAQSQATEQQIADAVMDADKAAAAIALGSPPGQPGLAGVASKAADVGAFLDALHMLGVPVPDSRDIPLIGPLLNVYLKARLAGKVFRRLPGKIGETAETVIAGKAAAVQQRVYSAIDTALGASGKAVSAVAPQLGGVTSVLGHKIFDDNEPQKKASKTPARTSKGDLQQVFMARADELDRAMQPGAIRDALRSRIRTSDPAIIAAIVAAEERKLQFVDSKRPRPNGPGGMLLKSQFIPGRVRLNTWSRYLHAANDPASVIESAAAGHPVTPEGAETLRTVYPTLFNAARRRLIERLGSQDETKALPLSRRVALSTLFDLPLDLSMDPAYAAFLQADYAPPPAAQQPQPMQGQPTISSDVALGQRVDPMGGGV